MMRPLAIFLICCFSFPALAFSDVKYPNVAGQFYPDKPEILFSQVDEFLRESSVAPYAHRVPLIIAPHAGYVYSGLTAAYAFKSVSRRKISSVIILAPSHFFDLDGFSIWDKGAFETPLGRVPVDEELTGKILNVCELCSFESAAFEKEHSLEVEIPFIQKVFPQAKIVPVIVGQADVQRLESLANVLGSILQTRDDVLVVVSTDWSHYHDEATAWQMDTRAIHFVKKLDVEGLLKQAQARQVELCGLFPVLTGMLLARQQGWTQVDVLKIDNSSTASGDKHRVVGYAAMAFYAPIADSSPSGLSFENKRALLKIARTTVEEFVTTGKILSLSSSEDLKNPNGVFVTLKKHGELRGCIGRIVTDEPLDKSTRDMAVASASEDPRFPPVRPEELSDIEVEVSVLSVPRQVKDHAEIIIGQHGVIVSQGFRKGIFLPQVAEETGWSKEKFLSELCSQKAGLSRDCWQDPKTRIEIFTADAFTEQDVF